MVMMRKLLTVLQQNFLDNQPLVMNFQPFRSLFLFNHFIFLNKSVKTKLFKMFFLKSTLEKIPINKKLSN
jgi:hypothetical protein